MGRDRLDRSRRKVIHAVVTAIPAALLFPISRIEAAEKMTRQQAEYQDGPDGIYSCGMCTLFESRTPARWSKARSAKTAGARRLHCWIT
jgi:hypothetical protein